MYCGNCLRDNALVRAMRGMGHEVLMVPLYLPLTLDEKDESEGTPIFFSGVSVYLEQQSAIFRNAPAWFHRLLASRGLLKWASGRAAKTRAEELGALTYSMLQGEDGNQAREIDTLLDFLRAHAQPEVVSLSNLLLTGLVRRTRKELGCAVAVMMQGEDSFLDALPESHRKLCWERVGENARAADLLIATSKYYADLMCERLRLDPARVRVVHSGINMEGFDGPSTPRANPEPTIGFFARMCREKGLDTLVDAFIELRKRGRVPNARLKIGGSCGPSDEPLVEELKALLAKSALIQDVEFYPNLDRAAKIQFLKSLDVFSVPARYGEAFGLYIVESLAAGVPVVQPATAAFPEIIEKTGGGLLFTPGSPSSLADALETLLRHPQKARSLAKAGQQSVREHFTSDAAAREILRHYRAAVGAGACVAT